MNDVAELKADWGMNGGRVRGRRGMALSELLVDAVAIPRELPTPRAETYEVARTATVNGPELESEVVLSSLAAADRTGMPQDERWRMHEKLARMVPELLKELRIHRLVLRDLKGAIERGEEMGRYVERIKDMLPVRIEDVPTFASPSEMPNLWARGTGELPR